MVNVAQLKDVFGTLLPVGRGRNRATIEARNLSSKQLLWETFWQRFGVKMLNEARQEQLTQKTHYRTQFDKLKISPKTEKNPFLFKNTKGRHITVSDSLWNSLLPKWLRV